MKKTHHHTRSQASFNISSIPLTQFSHSTPSDIFDLRCEYEVPRFIDLSSPDTFDRHYE